MSRRNNNSRNPKRPRSAEEVVAGSNHDSADNDDSHRIEALRAVGLEDEASRRALHQLEHGLAWASTLTRAQIVVLLTVSPPLLAFLQRVVSYNIRAVAGAASAAATVLGAVAAAAGAVTAALGGQGGDGGDGE
tara:strand:- start:1113 stop:1514 length:402 start_codon:yes stop_codon:yes gene_type:complete